MDMVIGRNFRAFYDRSDSARCRMAPYSDNFSQFLKCHKFLKSPTLMVNLNIQNGDLLRR